MSTALNLSISEALFNQVQRLAERLNISEADLVEMALENFIRAEAATPNKDIIHQGDIYWVQLENLNDGEPSIPHPQVVIQADILNQSRIHTVVVCGLTTNLKRANLPGHVLLEAGEANLPKASIVEVSKVSTINKTQLGDYIGSLSEQRIHQILAGMRFLQASFFTR